MPNYSGETLITKGVKLPLQVIIWCPCLTAIRGDKEHKRPEDLDLCPIQKGWCFFLYSSTHLHGYTISLSNSILSFSYFLFFFNSHLALPTFATIVKWSDARQSPAIHLSILRALCLPIIWSYVGGQSYSSSFIRLHPSFPNHLTFFPDHKNSCTASLIILLQFLCYPPTSQAYVTEYRDGPDVATSDIRH